MIMSANVPPGRSGTRQKILLADLETHFQTLARSPAEVLRHIGSPFAPDKEKEASLPPTHAA